VLEIVTVIALSEGGCTFPGSPNPSSHPPSLIDEPDEYTYEYVIPFVEIEQ